ncbi:MAG TPA: creatininase family protein [Candidatus Thermoplasmatota archaeon]|nr:creatininase family protein [Candidatus Thermoplasmatota archaeon]
MPLRLGELTSPAFAALTPKPPLLVPVGIVEEHGPHLPLDTDTIQAVATCEAAAERLGAMVAPALSYGNCSSTRNFPGSFSLSFDTLRAIARDILLDCVRHGIGTVAFVSGHAGGAHMRALKLAAEEVVECHPALRVFVLSDYELVGVPDRSRGQAADTHGRGGGLDTPFPTWDGHAGGLETSRMLALRPDLVKGSAAPHQVQFADFLVEPHPETRFPSGVMGDPTLASAEIGRRANAWIVDRLVEVLQQKG